MTTTAGGGPVVLSRHLRQERAAHPRLSAELAVLLTEIALAGKIIAREVARATLTGTVGYTGETNVQGEPVKRLDEWANAAMVEGLRAGGLVCTMVSEEMAGGRASTGTGRILDLVATDHHQRVPLFIGSAEEVGRAEACCRQDS